MFKQIACCANAVVLLRLRLNSSFYQNLARMRSSAVRLPTPTANPIVLGGIRQPSQSQKQRQSLHRPVRSFHRPLALWANLAGKYLKSSNLRHQHATQRPSKIRPIFDDRQINEIVVASKTHRCVLPGSGLACTRGRRR